MELGGRVRALDGLRGIALVAVLAYHAAPELLGGGFLGVEVFFVLSGFLLVTLLLDEEERRGLIDPWRYAARRLRRIAPALVVLLMGLALVAPVLARDDAHRLSKDIVASLLGLTNWHLVQDGSSYFAQTGRPPLVRHLWSIAVEAQVYLVIPFLAAFCARQSRRCSVALLLLGIAASATVMGLLYVSPDPSRAYYGTDARISALLTGALVAVLVRRRDGSAGRARLTPRASMLLFASGSVVLWVLFVAMDERGRVLYPAGFLLTQLAAAGVIVSALLPGRPQRILSDPALRWLGVRSYGIYLWHWPIVALFRPELDVGWPRGVVASVGIAAAVGLGALSYRFVERPFLEGTGVGVRPLPIGTRVGAVAWVAALVAVVALVGRSATVDPIAESILAGEQALADQALPEPATTAKPRAAAKGSAQKAADRQQQGKPVAKPASVPGNVPSSGGPKPGTVKVSAVGDSVMLGAASRMKTSLGDKCFINAEKNRRYSEGAAVVHEWAKTGHLATNVIVHLGNNGPAKLEEIEAVIKEAKTAKAILLVTVRVSKPWEKTTNDAIQAAAKKHAKVILVDWNKATIERREWFYSDGTHMNSSGAEAYVKLLASKIPKTAKPKPKATPRPTPKPTPTPDLVGDVIDPG